MSSKIIKTVNGKISIVKSLSFLSYGRCLYGTLLKKYSAYANFIFMIQNCQSENYVISIFSLCFLALFYIFGLILFVETGNDMLRVRKRRKILSKGEVTQIFDDYQKSLISLTEKKYDVSLIPTQTLNICSRTAVLLEFDCLTSLFDQFSNKNALKIHGIYIPQLIIFACGKSMLYDIPNFVLQVYKYSGLSVLDYKSIITLTLSILSIINSFIRLFNAKASRINKQELKSLEKNLEDEENVKESQKKIIVQLVY